jgi:rhodanese-related sulfurtransferase
MSSFEVDAAMPSPTEITVAQLCRLVGLPGAPVLADVRTEEEFNSGPQLIPTAHRHASTGVEVWWRRYAGQPIVVLCQSGGTSSQAVAARLRHEGLEAQTLAGGYDAWREFRQPLVRASRIPRRDDEGRTVWVTRARPKVVRVACPWLIRRFVDPSAVFLFVASSEVGAVAERFGATAFDIENVFWSHRGEFCTFDVMVREFGLSTPPLERLATMVRAADTARLDLSPEAPGLLAASLGLSRIYDDDLEQLNAGCLLYDAFYRWCRDATKETHNWPTNKVKP